MRSTPLSLSLSRWSPALLCVAVLALPACANLLPSLAGEPPALYELAPVSAEVEPVSAEVESATRTKTPRRPVQMLIDVAQSSAGLDSPRIALVQKDGTLAYFKGVSWTDRAPVMVQTLLVKSFDNAAQWAGVGRESLGLRSDYLLKPELEALQADYTQGPVPVVRMSLRLKLVAMPRRVIVASELFTADVRAESDTQQAIHIAFRQGSQQVIARALTWTRDQTRGNVR